MAAHAEGDPHADLWLVGRASASDAREGRPLSGRPGAILDDALAQAGIRRTDCYCSTDLVTLPVTLDRYRPKLVVAFGDEAFRACLADNAELPNIQQARGYLWDRDMTSGEWVGWQGSRQGFRDASRDVTTTRILATTHPAECDVTWVPWRALLDIDLRRAKVEVASGCPALPVRDVTLVTDIDQADAVRAVVRSAPLLSLDIEGDHNRLDCLGVAADTSTAFVIPYHEEWQRQLVRDVCESDAPKVGQNLQYDRYVLRRFNDIELQNQVLDLQLMWHSLQPELAGKKVTWRGKAARHTQKSLGFFASIYTREPYWKHLYGDAEDELYLCGVDVCVTLEVALKMERELETA